LGLAAQTAALGCTCEGDRDRASVLDHLAGGRELAGAGFYRERHDGVACLIGRVQKTSRGIKTDKPGRRTLCRLRSDRSQCTARRIGAVDGDAVMTTIGTVYETPIWCDGDFSSGAVSGKLGWQRRDDLCWRQRSILVLPAVGCCCAVELVEHPDHRKLWVERQMARSGAGARLDRGGLGRRELTTACIEPKDENPIQTLVGDKDEAAGGIEHHVMRMRTGLLDLVGAGLRRPVSQRVLIFK